MEIFKDRKKQFFLFLLFFISDFIFYRSRESKISNY